jgi:hypothetical protein
MLKLKFMKDYLDEESLFAESFTSEVDGRTLFLARIDERHDSLRTADQIQGEEISELDSRRTATEKPEAPGTCRYRRDLQLSSS